MFHVASHSNLARSSLTLPLVRLLSSSLQYSSSPSSSSPSSSPSTPWSLSPHWRSILVISFFVCKCFLLMLQRQFYFTAPIFLWTLIYFVTKCVIGDDTNNLAFIDDKSCNYVPWESSSNWKWVRPSLEAKYCTCGGKLRKAFFSKVLQL